ncbi:MAG TPA: hypothetical protein PKY35_00180 [Candidatus Hydrogenedentes bacterium]|nr:hypothetical protein [Candidatus Hydrogenedentota bacterium]HOL75418.1 hypothetical protein [Candidatus Hydrogenedentota bacterium]HPO84927.1 hypothetical protein [Candidatus Hydrogenedentota bacterium]
MRIKRRTAIQGIASILGAPMLGMSKLRAEASYFHESLPYRPRVVPIPAWYYQHFDADFQRDVPEEGFGGWRKEPIELDLNRVGVVAMHIWEMGTFEKYPGWWRVVPWAKRAQKIVEEELPVLFSKVRASGVSLFHVVSEGKYYKSYSGYQQTASLSNNLDTTILTDVTKERLEEFHKVHVFPGDHNQDDILRGFQNLDFPEGAKPQDGEGIAENGAQLFAQCKARGINHLIYCGFTVDGCLLLSPGGMADMQRYGFLCSVLREATTAIENRETAREELAKRIALWRVALSYGFVFDVPDFLNALCC